MRVGAADVAVQRHAALFGDGLGRRERHPEQRVGAEAALGVGSVEGAQSRVEDALIGGVEADDGIVDLAVDVGDGVLHAEAAVALFAVSEFDCLVGAGARSGWHRGPGAGAGDQLDLDLDRRVAAGVQDFPGRHVIDDAQVNSRYEWCEGSGSNPGNGSERAFVVAGSWGRTGVGAGTVSAGAPPSTRSGRLPTPG